jgi:hypothetical protein
MGNSSLHDLPDSDQEHLLVWIDAHWNDLAAFAWRNCVADGRGLVLLSGDPAGDVLVGYQTPTMAADAGFPWPPALLDAVQSYDPATDIVFLVATRGTGMLLGMTTVAGRQPPHLAGRKDEDTPLVRSA